jgi:hypothetical protein
MRGLKLIDIVLQGTALLVGIMFLFVFGGAGYLYWINMGILGWIVVSSLLHIVIIKKQGVGRIAFVSIYALAILAGLIAHFSDVSFARINFYLQPLSYMFIIFYLILSMLEYQEHRTPKEDALDF